MPKSPTSCSMSGQKVEDSDEEYLYNNTLRLPPQYTPNRRRNRMGTPSRQVPPAYTDFPRFESSSSSSSIVTIRQRPLTPIKSAGALKEMQLGEKKQTPFSPHTLTQSRCDDKIQAAKTAADISESSIPLNLASSTNSQLKTVENHR